MKNILIIGAHFDDAELGAGGSAAKWVSQGKKVYKYTLTDNETIFPQRNIHVKFEDSKRQRNRLPKPWAWWKLKTQTLHPMAN